MSEAEKAADVEDVLSSIRRMVASGPQSVPKALSPSDIVTDTADCAPETQSEPEQVTEPANFIDKINASIAEITEDAEVDVSEEADADTKDPIMEDAATKEDETAETDISAEPDAPAEKAATVEEDPLDDPKTRSAHVDAFLANDPVSEADLAAVFADITEKPAPFVLRADMAADIKPALTPAATPDVPEEPEQILQEEDDAQVEHEAAFQDIPDDDMVFADIEDSPAEDTAIQPADEQFIDEDMLREIVGELVRNELQGDLGDRITRNVRKLVRREIHQALAARDFD